MMTKMISISGLVVLLSMLIMLSQCTTVHEETAPPPDLKPEKIPDVHKETAPPPDLKPEKIPGEIERLEEIADKHADPSIRAKAYLQLAKLYSSYKNTKPNYQQALKKLEMYLSFEPANGETDEMQSWLALLRELVKEHDEIRKAKQTINQLAKENKELKDAVEELKKIDIQMEEKRKLVK